MKSTVKNSNSVLKTIAVAATAAVLFAGSPISSFANTVSEKNKTANFGPESAVNVQYIGADEKMFEFKVEFENPTAQKFTLIVKNDEGDVIYSKDFSDVHFSRTIHLMREGTEMESIRPTIAISIGTRLVQRSFAIERKVTENLTVTKL
ncbi:MAG TPA: hypothetical protein VKT28_19050 [Puia sp.]|nr:hypothetical protein [Puia sp.]